MDLRKLKTLIDLVAESGIAELEITEGEGKVRIVKFSQTLQPVAYHQPGPAWPPRRWPRPLPPLPRRRDPRGHVVKAPMVGTFYRSPNGRRAFHRRRPERQGRRSLCIIEAMKLLNEIEADKSGVIKEILVENGEPVEYGQPLFVIG